MWLVLLSSALTGRKASVPQALQAEAPELVREVATSGGTADTARRQTTKVFVDEGGEPEEIAPDAAAAAGDRAVIALEETAPAAASGDGAALALAAADDRGAAALVEAAASPDRPPTALTAAELRGQGVPLREFRDPAGGKAPDGKGTKDAGGTPQRAMPPRLACVAAAVALVLALACLLPDACDVCPPPDTLILHVDDRHDKALCTGVGALGVCGAGLLGVLAERKQQPGLWAAALVLALLGLWCLLRYRRPVRLCVEGRTVTLERRFASSVSGRIRELASVEPGGDAGYGPGLEFICGAFLCLAAVFCSPESNCCGAWGGGDDPNVESYGTWTGGCGAKPGNLLVTFKVEPAEGEAAGPARSRADERKARSDKDEYRASFLELRVSLRHTDVPRFVQALAPHAPDEVRETLLQAFPKA